ncbi:NfeD family protein [Roseateles sp. PN1]|uniref:NfeD family protein n=1 Tax=Roseateles sp. PN1 TaxID=3137372 RepID=UPI00313A00EC
MEMTLSTAWWIAAGLLVAIELGTGSFYLLMLAIGCAAGAIAAHLGLGGSAQMVAAAGVGGAAVALWHRKRSLGTRALPANANPDVLMDIGQSVQVKHWHADGSTQVQYRGAEWQARFAGTGAPTAGRYTIRAIEGSRLLLDH